MALPQNPSPALSLSGASYDLRESLSWRHPFSQREWPHGWYRQQLAPDCSSSQLQRPAAGSYAQRPSAAHSIVHLLEASGGELAVESGVAVLLAETLLHDDGPCAQLTLPDALRTNGMKLFALESSICMGFYGRQRFQLHDADGNRASTHRLCTLRMQAPRFRVCARFRIC